MDGLLFSWPLALLVIVSLVFLIRDLIKEGRK